MRQNIQPGWKFGRRGSVIHVKMETLSGQQANWPQPILARLSNLAPRHLLIGKSDSRWFVFTPKNVQHPFILDGIPLQAGERKFFQYFEHQAEFSGHVFGSTPY